MKKLIFFLLIILGSLSLFAQPEPIVKIYQSDGSSKQYSIDSIANLSFIHSNLSYSMYIVKKDSSRTAYDIRHISSINFQNNQILQIIYGFEPVAINISEIDSIIFTFNTCEEIQIGNQIWMCKNLDVDHYRNGDHIHWGGDSIFWAAMQVGQWCYYNNDPEQGKIYGKLYNWYAVNDPRGLAPEGWHIPSDSEWTELINYVKNTYDNDKLKVADTIYWHSSNVRATNESGFTALPGGSRYWLNGSFGYIGHYGFWWSSTKADEGRASSWYMSYEWSGPEEHYEQVSYGFSVRCIKDK